jgi:hypothetical protein
MVFLRVLEKIEVNVNSLSCDYAVTFKLFPSFYEYASRFVLCFRLSENLLYTTTALSRSYSCGGAIDADPLEPVSSLCVKRFST